MAAEISDSPWTNLPSDLLLFISSFLIEKIDISRLRSVCRAWRSSIPRIPNPNFISNLFSGSLFCNGIYLLKNRSLSFILSIQEYEPGKLLLRHPITYEPIIKSSADSLNSLVSGCTITPIALSHSLETEFKRDWESKPCFIPQFHSSPDEECKFYRNGNWLPYSRKKRLVNCKYDDIESFVNFCGCTYAVNYKNVYLVDQCGSKPLTCVKQLKPPKPSMYTKRFVVSDGDLYLVFNFRACVPCFYNPDSDHKCCIYKVVMDDLKRPTSYTMESVTILGDRALFFTWDCSFSISTRQLPPRKRPFLENRVFIAKSAFPGCRCRHDGGFRVYSPQGKFIRSFRSTLALFEPPPVWIKKLNGLLDK